MKKARIEKKLRRKTNPMLVETIIACKKKKNWLQTAHFISMPKHKQVRLNLRDIDIQAENNAVIIIPGKVLSEGEITKKIKISALNFSKKAREKLKIKKIEINYILEEVNKNPDAKNTIILNKRVLKNKND